MQASNENKNIGDKLRSHGPKPWDKEGMWKSLDAQLPAEEDMDRGGFIFKTWPFLALFIILGSIGLYVLTDSKNENKISENQHSIISTNTDHLTKEKNSTEDAFVSDVSKNSLSDQDKKTASNLQTTKDIKLNSNSSSNEESGSQNSSSKQNRFAEKEAEYPNTIISNVENSFSSDQTLQTKNKNTVSDLQTKESEAILINKIEDVSLLKRVEHPLFSEFDELDAKNFVFNFQPDSLTQAQIDSIVQHLILKPIDKWTLSVETFGGYGLSIRSMSRNTGSISDDFDNRVNHETPLDVKEAGFLLSLNNKSNFSIKMGVLFQESVDRFEWSTSAPTSQMVNYEQAFYHLGPNMTRTYIPAIVEATGTLNREVIHYNKHQYIGLPLLFGYNKSFGGWSTEITTGFVLNLNYQFSGRILKFGLPTDIDSFVTKELYNKNIGVGFTAGYKVNYKIGRNISAFAQGSFQYNPASLISQQALYDQRYSYMTLRLGLSRNLGKL